MDPGRWRTVRALFDELAGLDPDERAHRLTEIAGADPELRGHVEALLRADRESSGGVRWGTVREEPYENNRTAGDWLGLTGRQISHFRVQEPLGSGGMGVVYRAEDVRLNRPVALKFPLPHTQLDPSSRARFLREARAIAALDHPNVCTIYDVGESSQGYLFIAMPLYEGETLAARLARSGALQVDETVKIAKQIAAGLAGAHAAGVVHRDLKPANIMLAPDGTVKLLDFGLAKSEELSLSMPGAAVGTLSYMAPEQLAGGVIDQRTDLWAVGVLLYQMLIGRRPFQASSDAAVARAVRNDPAVAPGNLRQGVPQALNSCVLRLLEKDPERRYSSAVELLNDLEVVDHGEVGVRAASAGADSGGRRRRLGRGRAAAITVGLVGFSAIVTLISLSLPSGTMASPSIAVLPFINFSPGPTWDPVAAGLHDDVVTQLARIGGIRVASRGAVAPYVDADRAPERIADALGVSTLLEGTIQRIGDAVRINIRLIDASSGDVIWADAYESDAPGLLMLHREIAVAVATELRGSLAAEERQAIARVQTDNAKALEAYWQGRFHSQQLTPPALRMALEAFDRALALDSTFAIAWAARSEACVSAFVARVVPALEPCVAAAENAMRLDDQLSEAHAALAQARMLQWDWARSEAGFRHALALDSTSELALQGYGILLRMLERPEEAKRQFRRAAEASPENLYARTQVGWVLFDQRRYDEALALYDEVIRRDPTFWLPVYNQGMVYAILRDSVHLREAIERILPLTGEGSPHVWVLRGHYHAIRGERDAALAASDHVCGGAESANCLGGRAGALHVLGEDEEALSLLERAADARDPFLPHMLSEPWFDDLGNHPRLVALRRRIGVERR